MIAPLFAPPSPGPDVLVPPPPARDWPAGVLTLFDGLGEVWQDFPLYFLPAFDGASPEQARTLGRAGLLLASTIMTADRVMDGEFPPARLTGAVLGIEAQAFEAYRTLHGLFAADSCFWAYLRDYLQEYAAANLDERRLMGAGGDWGQYAGPHARGVAVGKSSVSKAALAGLAALADREDRIAPLSESVDLFNLGMQLYDDLCDWRRDALAGQPSLLLSRLLTGPVRPTDAAAVDALARRVYYEGHASDVLAESVVLFGEARRVAQAAAPGVALPWLGVVDRAAARSEALRQDLDRVVRRNLSDRRPVPVVAWPEGAGGHDACYHRGIGFLAAEWRRHFGEARHQMVFPHAEGFTSEREVQSSNVFQRALIAEALTCVDDPVLGPQLRPLVAAEADYLVAARVRDGAGGWSYFPELPEQPADADTLAQVMQVLLRVGRRADVVRYCEGPLDVLLTECAHPDGAFETWIIRSRNPSARDRLQAHWAECAWGTGAHVEVIANLLHALRLYDAERFAPVVARGAAYLAAQQAARGHWESRWYEGPYYGTYACLRVLSGVAGAREAVARARAFLREAQRADGGWGDAASDATSTALALMALAEVARGGDARRLARGAAWLRAAQTADGSWPESRFIRMLLRLRDHTTKYLYYRGRTVTTALAVRALATLARTGPP